MLKITKKNAQSIDKYELLKSVNVPDIKTYLVKEYERADQREQMISSLEIKIEELQKVSLKYDALLVVQEQTQKRIDKQNEKIKELTEKIQHKNDEIKLLNSKIADVKMNAEIKLKNKDSEIKELKNQIRNASKKRVVKK